ncbi:TrlF family AAA-like ATPase [Arcobacter ellisii]|uniref:Histidinol-phosphatase n=1 Tax=Arcobacter ellisii TaxID=913109 RepID=A0A347UA22_9BACT|nr:PHP domain-containing protein [Arcobacter ellisii]AXX95700.1 putative metal-dependent phosphatase (AAA domain) [Arcobacter ellisii]RXI31427.1 histidinol-phosphatase [Arcobacter ellisii]
MEEINNLNFGADFVRADLHIHSYGKDGSFDVTDSSMTPQNIVDIAIENNLSIISITDHNEIQNSKKAIDYANNKNILVIPGIEISTTQGHLLVYFETYEQLRKFFGKLTISDDKERCEQGIVQCLRFASEFNGFGVLAHIELDSGFEKVIGRFNKVIEDIFIHPSLLALEISSKNSIDYYTDVDTNDDRKKLLNERRTKLEQRFDLILPKIMSSDAHKLDKLGTNADGDKRLTRFKVDSLSFHALKIALISYESRVRLENMIPEKIPHFIGLKFKGGLLDEQKIRFSKNLTCIIGGRGTGKSTMLESLREVSGNVSTSKVKDTDIWSDEISMFYEDETGRQIEFKREKNSSSINITDMTDGIIRIPIESYGQGETASTIQHSDDNPKVLLDFLDSFIEIEPLIKEDQELCELLLENQSSLTKARIEVKGIPDTRKQITNISEKVKKLEQDKVGDLVKYQMSLANEKKIRDELISKLKKLIDNYRDVLNDEEAFKSFSGMTDDEIIIGKEEFLKVKIIVEEFSNVVKKTSVKLNEELVPKVGELKIQLDLWKDKEKNILTKIDEKKSELEKQGIPFDLGKINQIIKDLAYYQDRLKKQEEILNELKELEKNRKDLIKRRKEVKKEIYKQRFLFSNVINNNLKDAVDEFFIKAEYKESTYSPEFENSIKDLMGWRTSQVSKAKIIANELSVMDFCEGVKKKNLSSLAQIKEDGKRVFQDEEINNIIERAIDNYKYEDFEAFKYDDKPSLSVTKIIDDNGAKKYLSRSISQLSLGQQQSILLAILIQSKSRVPLLIDQPEDNLDSEFIYKTIVSNLRRIKEKRQVIVVTHNPNIAVLGDAELVIPLKSTSIKSFIIDSGSIDNDATRELCCSILEGGKQAFIRRQEIYGLKVL